HYARIPYVQRTSIFKNSPTSFCRGWTFRQKMVGVCMYVQFTGNMKRCYYYCKTKGFHYVSDCVLQEYIGRTQFCSIKIVLYSTILRYHYARIPYVQRTSIFKNSPTSFCRGWTFRQKMVGVCMYVQFTGNIKG